jgi:surface-anchored protein
MHLSLSSVAGLLAAVVVVAPAPAAAQPAPVVLSVGHVDVLQLTYEGGELALSIKDDSGGEPVTRNPADVVLQALPGSRGPVPEHPDFGFLGAPGDPVWILPEIQNHSLLWPGWNTEPIPLGVFQEDLITLTLTEVVGPGKLFVYIEDFLGLPEHQFSSEPGFPDSTVVRTDTHVHANWAFTAEGSYTLRFEAEATLPDGTTVSTGPVDYHFVVGELAGDPEVQLTVEGAERSYAPGEQVTLVAVPQPDPGLTQHAWYRRCPGEDGFAVVPGETVRQYGFTATVALDGCAYQAELLDGSGALVARSAPVTLTVADPGDPGDPERSQLIVASISELDGALVMSVDPDDRVVTMSPVELAATGDRLASTGELRPITVTDTRPAAPGWDASGSLGPFATADGDEFGSRFAGWTPTVASQAPGQGVVAGPPVPTGFISGLGLSGSARLASAPHGTGLGTAVLGAGLRLELPTETSPGQYRALLTLTVI